MNDIKCPYCNKDLEINHDDGYGYDENLTHQQQCGFCNKTFTYTTQISFDYDAQKADCLNGDAEHQWKPTVTHPKFLTNMRCSVCDEEREPTPKERIEHGIPTYEDYIKEKGDSSVLS